MKNFIQLRKIANILYFMAFILSAIALICFDEKSFSLFGIDFFYNKVNGMFMFLANFVLFLFNLNSKNSIRKMQKLFYPISFLMLILLNLILFVDNLFVIFLILFMLFFANYLLNKSKEEFTKDCITLFISFVLISWGLLRYFTLNEIAPNLMNIAQNQYKIDSFSINLALFGFLILISKLFNFIPFGLKAKNSFTFSFDSMIYLIIGCDILVKTFVLFNYFFYKLQDIFVIYLVINVLYFTLLQFRAGRILEFLKLSQSANIAIGIFGLFLYNESGFISFIYYSVFMILSYGAGYILSDIIEKKMHTDNFLALKKISHNDRLIKFFIFVVFLNLAKAPPCVAFCAFIYSFLNIFLTEMSNIFMSLVPYVLFICAFLLSLNSISVLGKILIEPVNQLKSFKLSIRQKFVLSVICFALFVSGIGIKYVVSQFMNIVDTGSM